MVCRTVQHLHIEWVGSEQRGDVVCCATDDAVTRLRRLARRLGENENRDENRDPHD